jgi:mannose-6-phosphate isomerase-like protein (cupin superfamily)
MKLIKKEEAKIFKNSSACTAIEYPLGDSAINGAVIELNGRYPDKGRAVNELCKELFYVIKGSGKVEVDSREFEIS